MTGPTTSIVVCAYTNERWDDLCEAVGSAARQQPAPDQVLLVIDHNPELLERARRELLTLLPALEVTENTRKKGLSGARNTALEQVSGDVVVFLDDDANANPGWLGHLLTPYADAAVIAVGGSATPRWPGAHGRPVTLPSADGAGWGELDWVVGCSYAGQPTTTAAVRNLMGCNMSFRRVVFEQVGGFSEDLGRVGKVPLGCEETELCIRATNATPGSRIIFEPRALVRHHVSEDRLTWAYLRRRCFAEGLSKAAVSAMVGQDQALSTERGYATRVLPRGVLRELFRAASGRRPGAAASAGAIVVALTATVLGYVRGRAARPLVLGTTVPRIADRPAGAEASR